MHFLLSAKNKFFTNMQDNNDSAIQAFQLLEGKRLKKAEERIEQAVRRHFRDELITAIHHGSIIHRLVFGTIHTNIFENILDSMITIGVLSCISGWFLLSYILSVIIIDYKNLAKKDIRYKTLNELYSSNDSLESERNEAEKELIKKLETILKEARKKFKGKTTDFTALVENRSLPVHDTIRVIVLEELYEQETEDESFDRYIEAKRREDEEIERRIFPLSEDNRFEFSINEKKEEQNLMCGENFEEISQQINKAIKEKLKIDIENGSIFHIPYGTLIYGAKFLCRNFTFRHFY